MGTATQTYLRPSTFKGFSWHLKPAESGPQVKDIGGRYIDERTRHRLLLALQSKTRGERVVLPDELLYDDIGLQIWSDIIYLRDYYQTEDETAILKIYGDKIASFMPTRANLVDLGAGDTRKVSHLIKALVNAKKAPNYYALDISEASLHRNLGSLSRTYPEVRCTGLWGTFSDATRWIDKLPSPRVFLSLGSVLCNDAWDTALHSLRSWACILRPDDLILIGMDGHDKPAHKAKLERSYHPLHKSQHDDPFARFWRNGFHHANRLVGERWFHENDWQVTSLIEYKPSTSHRFIFRAKRDITLGSTGVAFREGDEMDWFDAHKYGEQDVREMCQLAGLEVLKIWKRHGSEMRSYLVKRADAGPTGTLTDPQTSTMANTTTLNGHGRTSSNGTEDSILANCRHNSLTRLQSEYNKFATPYDIATLKFDGINGPHQDHTIAH